MLKLCNEIVTRDDSNLLISQALRCLESRFCSGMAILNSSIEVRQYLQLQLADELDEVFAVLFLNSQNQLLAFEKLFYGTVDEATVYPRMVVRKALDYNACKIIVAHNHPSGNCNPSKSDIEMIKQLQRILEIIDVSLIDHFVVTHQDSYSFADHGLL